MTFKTIAAVHLLAAFSTLALTSPARAADADDQPGPGPASNTNSAAGRYGLFDGLDHRSAYTQEIFPEPFLVEDMALEDNEFELNWLHARAGAQRTDVGSVEIQKGFGLLTLEAEVPYERMVAPGQESINGIGNIQLDARYPFYQCVSADQMIDSTFGLAMEGDIPADSSVSQNAELDPEIFDALRLGRHFTVQAVLGYSRLLGGGDDGGLQTFEYGFSLAYAIPHRQLPLPGVQAVIPMAELSGERGLNLDEAGQNSVLADVGFRIQMKPAGELHSDVGFAFVFPIDNGAREELHWGFIISSIFDF